jgi:hypothetical protein
MNPLRAILVLLGMWLGPVSLAPGIFPVIETSTTTTSTSTTLQVEEPTTSTITNTTLRLSSTTLTTIRVVVPADDIWWQLALCEDGGKNRQFGSYHGYFHFALATWHGVGGDGAPEDYDYATQLHFAQILQRQEGWWPWPGCKAKLGL